MPAIFSVLALGIRVPHPFMNSMLRKNPAGDTLGRAMLWGRSFTSKHKGRLTSLC